MIATLDGTRSLHLKKESKEKRIRIDKRNVRGGGGGVDQVEEGVG